MACQSWQSINYVATPQHTVTSDISTPITNRMGWADSSIADANTMVKELIPLVAAAALWGHGWSGGTVLCQCDNQAMDTVLKFRTFCNKTVMHLLWSLFFSGTMPCVCIRAHNKLADDIFHNHLPLFLKKVPSMFLSLCQVLQQLRELLFHHRCLEGGCSGMFCSRRSAI